MKQQNFDLYMRLLHFLAGITIGYLLFACKSSRSGCDAYSNNDVKSEITK